MGVLDEYFTDDRLKLAFTFQAKYLECPRGNVLGSLASCLTSNTATASITPRWPLGNLREYGPGHRGRRRRDPARRRGPRNQIPRSSRRFGGTHQRRYTRVRRFNRECRLRPRPQHHLWQAKGIQGISLLKKKYSCSTFMLYLGIDKVYEDQPHHHIIFADDYHKTFNKFWRDKPSHEHVGLHPQLKYHRPHRGTARTLTAIRACPFGKHPAWTRLGGGKGGLRRADH